MYTTAWEYVFSTNEWHMLPLPPESPEPAARSSQCSAITDDNEVFVYGGVHSTPPTGAARRILNDLWVFNSTCPATLTYPAAQRREVEPEPAAG